MHETLVVHPDSTLGFEELKEFAINHPVIQVTVEAGNPHAMTLSQDRHRLMVTGDPNGAPTFTRPDDSAADYIIDEIQTGLACRIVAEDELDAPTGG